jgi:hypothetical protein
MYNVIPLTNAPDSTQDFKITIGDENKHIKLILRYLDRFNVWIADIIDYPTDIPLVNCVPFVTGENFLAQYRYLGIGEAYIIHTKNLSKQNDVICIPAYMTFCL